MDRLITVTTDFGTRDPYVAAVKGVLLSGCPDAHIVDLSHEIAPFDVLEGALFVAAAVPYFPPGTVHLAVVDPGVGSARRGIVAAIGGQLIVCPDNGLLSLLSGTHPPASIHALAASPDAATDVSATFHGRDRFAPVAARLAAGTWQVADVGPAIDDPVHIELPAIETQPDGSLVATVIHVDRFGNAITNLEAKRVPLHARCTCGGRDFPVVRTYADVAKGGPCAVIGGAGLLELAVNQGSAAGQLGVRRGDSVIVAGPAS